MHGEKITAKAMFELLPVRRPILSDTRLVEKEFVVVIGNERGHKLCKNGREIPLHKYNGVYHVIATALSELCPLDDPRNDNVSPAEEVCVWGRGGGGECAMDTKTSTQTCRGRENITFSQSLTIQSLVL